MASVRTPPTTQTAVMAAVFFLLVATQCLGAPVEKSLQDSLKEEEDMLLLLVPSVPIQERSMKIDEDKVEYDLIAIPGEVLRREIRQTGHKYGVLDSAIHPKPVKLTKQASKATASSQFKSRSTNNRRRNTNPSTQRQTSSSIQSSLRSNFGPSSNLRSHFRSPNSQTTNANLKENVHDKRSFFQQDQSSDEGFLIGDFGGTTTTQSSKDIFREFGNVISTGSSIVSGVSQVVRTLKGETTTTTAAPGFDLKQIIRNKLNLGGGGTSTATQTQGGPDILGNVGSALAIGSTVVGGLAAVVGKLHSQNNDDSAINGLNGLGNIGGDALSGIQGLKGSTSREGSGGDARTGFQSFTDAATGGLRYVGRLSTSILRVLLQIPSIKARVLTEVVQAGQPLKKAVSDVIGENAGDMRTIIEAGTEIIRDGFDILIRLVTDVLALKGRMLASFGANGIDAGASLFDGGLRVGGAAVQSASDIAASVGRGVGDVVQIVSDSDIPPLPELPNIGSLFGGKKRRRRSIIVLN